MKTKIKKVSSLIISIFLLSSCWGGGGAMVFYNDDKKADARLEQVIEAIKTNDKVALKRMFSEYVLDEATDIDERINYLFEFVQGDIEDWALRGGSSPKSSNHGHIIKKLDFWYYVNTNIKQYLFTIVEYTAYTDNPEKIGLYSLMVTELDDEDLQFDGPGVYVP